MAPPTVNDPVAPKPVVEAPPSYPWRHEYLLIRPDQHIAWRAADAAEIDLDVVTGGRSGGRTGGQPGRERRAM